MVQTMKKNISIMKKYGKAIKKKGVNKVLFFGSRFRGNFYPESDFDVLLVSSKFKDMNKGQRSVFAFQEWKEDYSIDFLCFTPEEFQRNAKGLTIVDKAIKTGIEL